MELTDKKPHLFRHPECGDQTVLKDGRNGWQVNTFDGQQWHLSSTRYVSGIKFLMKVEKKTGVVYGQRLTKPLVFNSQSKSQSQENDLMAKSQKKAPEVTEETKAPVAKKETKAPVAKKETKAPTDKQKAAALKRKEAAKAKAAKEREEEKRVLERAALAAIKVPAKDITAAKAALRRINAAPQTVRADYLKIGQMFIDGKAYCLKEDGTVNNVVFGQWLDKISFGNDVIDKSKRSNIIWMTEKQEIIAKNSPEILEQMGDEISPNRYRAFFRNLTEEQCPDPLYTEMGFDAEKRAEVTNIKNGP